MIEATEKVRPALSDLLSGLEREKESWTAVESFSSWHSEGHVLSGRYEGLVPLSAPGPGERYSFEVDLDKCSSCKACVVACHSLNGLDEGESWRSTGILQHLESGRRLEVTSSCHHCDDPGCSNGCPTLAYEKRPDGIVRHLDDQCMGCRYCEWTCPYGAPKWNAERGIVRKCDLCHQRLAVGEAPACVQGCPNGAIAVRLVPRTAEPTLSLGGTVPPSRTLPSTRYVTDSDLDPAAMVPAHRGGQRPEESHAPLAFLLVATQWAVGTALLLASRELAGHPSSLGGPVAAAVLLVAGLALGSLHLGRPDRAWRAVLGWRRSWFSREVLAFGAAAPAFLGWAALPLVPKFLPVPPSSVLSASSALLGCLGVYCSARIYLATPRPFWNRPQTAWRFALATLGGGAVLAGAFGGPWIRAFGILSIATGLSKAWMVRRDARPLPDSDALAGTSRLLRGSLKKPLAAQSILFSAAVASALVGTVLASPGWFVLAALLRFGSDLVERVLFFRAALPARMPGGPLD